MLQMAVTGIIKNNFVVRTPQEMIVDGIYFDNEFWCSMKANFKNIMSTFFEGLLSIGRVLSSNFIFRYRITVSTGMIFKN